MKGLLLTMLIMSMLIVLGLVMSIIITTNLNNGLNDAYKLGFEKGHEQGYQTGLLTGNEVGYQQGSQIGYLRTNQGDDNNSDNSSEEKGEGFYFLYNPTYNELREILAQTKTGSVSIVHDYAEANGLRTAYVRAQIARPAPEGMVYVYQLVAFETVDKGLVIIEPWSYQEAKLEIGRRYSELNGFPPSPHDDTITKITIVW